MYSIDRSNMGPDQQNERRKQGRYPAYPIRHDGARDVYSKSIIHLGETVERNVIVELGDHDMGKQSRPGLPRSIGKVGISPDTVVSQSLQIMRFSTWRTIFTEAGMCFHYLHDLVGRFQE